MSWRPRKSFEYRWQSSGEGVIIYNVKTNAAFRLNNVAGAIWRLCDGTLDEEAIVTRVNAIFPEADRQEVAADVSLFLSELKNGAMVV